jgi:hypothetical protein
MNDRFQHVLKHFQLQQPVPNGIIGPNFCLVKRGILYFLCYQLSCFLSTAGGHKVGKSGKLCQEITFIRMFLLLLVKKKKNPTVPLHFSSSIRRKYHVAIGGSPFKLLCQRVLCGAVTWSDQIKSQSILWSELWLSLLRHSYRKSHATKATSGPLAP